MFSLVIPAGVANAEPSNPKGSLTIHKFEQEPGAKQGNPDGSELDNPPDGKALEGVTFTLTQTHKYDPANDKWTAYTGEPFTRVTDGNGIIKIDNIPLGRYKVQETAGPPHVNLNKEEYFVDIPMTNKAGTDANYNVHIYPKNETIRGNVKLTKIDGDSKKPLKGVKFSLHHKNGDKVEDTTTFETDHNGRITVDNLKYGDYYFKEIETIDGYMLGSQKVKFKIENSKETVKVSVKNYKEPDVEKEVDLNAVNRGEEVTYTITVDLPGDIKSYNSFIVTDELHQNLEFVEVVSQPNGFSFSQNDQKLTWNATPGDLNPGKAEFIFKAKVKEDAPANVVINNKAYIDYENQHGTEGHKDTDDIPLTPTAGNLKVVKQDGDDNKKKLKGAKFELRQGNKVVRSGTTDENGEINFKELDYGNYQLVETKAPEGYNKLRNPINITIDANNNDITYTVDNYKSGWELPKTGGMGTLFFTLIGLTFMGSALFMYIRRRRADA